MKDSSPYQFRKIRIEFMTLIGNTNTEVPLQTNLYWEVPILLYPALEFASKGALEVGGRHSLEAFINLLKRGLIVLEDAPEHFQSKFGGLLKGDSWEETRWYLNDARTVAEEVKKHFSEDPRVVDFITVEVKEVN